MDPFADITPLWDLSQATNFSQLPDDDFLALLQKQFPNSNQGDNNFGGFNNGINPQNISQFSLPNTQSPQSEDSTPSPPKSGEGSNKQSPAEMAEDTNDLKRKASDDDLEEGPSQKNQHTASGSKKTNSSTTRRKSSGASPDESRLMKRKEQNRAAQRAFRERKEKHVKDLEDKVAALEAKNEQATTENENLRDLLSRLQSENMTLKQQHQQPSNVGPSSFTFSVPKNAASATSPSIVKDPTFETSMFSSLPRFTYNGPETKYSNPLDMTSMMSFDPSVLNLLDETPQPTATGNAQQMDFNFGPEHSFIPTNYTTIASNPAFFSLASVFDQASNASSSPNPASSPMSTTTSNNEQSSFGFDMSSLTAWPTSSSTDAGTLDDLFGGFLNPPPSNMDFSSFLTSSPSSSSVSPVVHHTNINNSHFSGQSPATSASSSPSSHGSDPSLFSVREGSSSESDTGHDDGECPKTKQQCTEHLQNSGPSPFAPTNMSVAAAPVSSLSVMDHDQSDLAFLKSVACEKGSGFPQTEKNEHNVEVLSAWRSITRDPSFKECDITQLCSEFTSKARCDGSKVVLEPQGINGILEALAAKKQQHQKC